MTSAWMAFLHHLAAFVLVAALAVELVLVAQPIDAQRARRLAVIDAALGVSAGVVLVVGVLRVFYFEKGTGYYFGNAAFLAKIALFVLVALLSVYPTIRFVGWARAARRGEPLAIEASTIRRVRHVLHVELVGVVLLLFAAALMARGVGSLA
jgi:putative membrane protein